MNQNDSSPENFFDARTIGAMVLAAVVFIGWQFYMHKKYPEAFAKKEAAVESTKLAEEAKPVPGVPGTPTLKAAEIEAPKTVADAPVVEKLTPYRSLTMSFDISSKGMGVRNFQTVQYKDRKGEVVTIGQTTSEILPLETRLLGRTETLNFAVEKVNEHLFVGRAKVGGLSITKTLEILPEKYLLQFKVATTGQDARFVGLTTELIEQVDSATKGHLLLPQLEKQEFFVDTSESKAREIFGKDDLNKSWSKVRLASIGSQYFTQALLDKSPVIPEAKGHLNHVQDFAQISLQYPVLNPGQDFQIEYSAFVGPKSYNLLRAIDGAFANVVDFGWFSFIGRYIFDLLQWFYTLVHNWGMAIVCLTVVVRLLVLPFNVYSYKSMKQMQAIQPRIQALKERYKDDQQKANTEVMQLMRENKVNPLGGCLPVLLQFPIFIALYSVLGHTIELYQAPFMLWIQDLSLKDPYYILPVLMGITMFIQQKTTPNASMDPAQAKVLMMMPVLFTFFMVSLPSGLTLYMLVGAVFSVLQQTYFMKTTKTLSSGG